MSTTQQRPYRRMALAGSVVMIAALTAAPGAAANAKPVVAGHAELAASSGSATAAGETLPERGVRGDSERWCRRNVNVMGLAIHDGQRIAGAKVRLFAQRSGRDTTFSRQLKAQGHMRTNSQGGFTFVAACLPSTFVVEVSAGRVGSSRNKETLAALGARNEKYVVVTPATTVAVAYLEQHPDVTAREAVRRVTRHLGITAWGPKLSQLGNVTSTTASEFHAGNFLVAAKKHGGLQSFAAKEAGRITSTSRHSFAPKNYRPAVRPGFPDNRRKSPTDAPTSRFEDPISSILVEVASKAIYSALCVNLPPGPAANLVCTEPGTSDESSIANQLNGISQQLNELNTTVSDIQTALSNMGTELSNIQASIAQLQQQSTQQAYVNDANVAQQNYATAYNASGVKQVASLVQEAFSDLQILGAISPSTTWTPTATSTPTDGQICATMYNSTPTASGDDPLSICEDFLSQMEGFASPTNSYYSELFQALVGGPGVPQDDLLIYTYQQMLSMGGHVPVSGTDFANIQSNFAQIGALMDSAYSMAAAAAMFRESAISGKQPSCSNLITTGTLPASTPINVSDACRTLQSGLFVAAVHNAVAASVTVPPAGTVIDPSTNYVWWSYPVDLTGTSQSNPDFPFYPGAESGTYSPTPIQFFNMSMISVPGFPAGSQPILADDTSYSFSFADQAHLSQLFGDLLITHGSSVASTLNAHGFTGLGTTNGGMTWSNVGVDAALNILATYTYWQSTTPYPPDLIGCTGYPASVDNIFTCANQSGGNTFYGGQLVGGALAGHTWDLTSSGLPNASSITQCPMSGSAFPFDAGPLCWLNTFALLVDTSGPAAGPPPWWAPSMLQGVPSGGVAAIPVPEVSFAS